MRAALGIEKLKIFLRRRNQAYRKCVRSIMELIPVCHILRVLGSTGRDTKKTSVTLWSVQYAIAARWGKAFRRKKHGFSSGIYA